MGYSAFCFAITYYTITQPHLQHANAAYTGTFNALLRPSSAASFCEREDGHNDGVVVPILTLTSFAISGDRSLVMMYDEKELKLMSVYPRGNRHVHLLCAARHARGPGR